MFSLAKLARLSALVLAFTSQAAWAETFNLRATISDELVGLGPSGVLAARADIAGPTSFEIIDLGQNTVALRDTNTGRYLRTGISQYDYLRADSNGINAASMFRPRYSGDVLLLQSVSTGQYVGYNLRSGRLRAVFEAENTNIGFLMIRRQMPPAPQPPAPREGGRDDEPAPEIHLPFVGQWHVTHVEGAPVADLREIRFEPVPQATIRFEEDLRFQGFSGCNNLEGVLEVEGARIAVERLQSGGQNRCMQGAETLEALVERALLLARYFGLVQNGRALSVLDHQGDELLRLERG